MWQVPVKCKNALCEDGKQRNARITSQHPLDAFSIPACVQVKGKTVSGFLSYDDRLEIHTFLAYSDKTNGNLLEGNYRENVLKILDAAC